MKAKRFQSWMRSAAVSLAFAVTLAGQAQDFGGLQGGPDRTGVNSGATVNNAGRGLLTWFRPLLTDELGRTLIRNNTSTEVTRSLGWIDPLLIDEAAGNYNATPAVPTTDPVNVAENLLRGLYVPGGIPGYSYALTVPSAAGAGHPLNKNFAADNLAVFEWAVQPPAVVPNQRFPRNYALYVWLPIGPTGDGAGGLIFPQRYFVYQVETAPGVATTEIIDTYQAGFGWVRIGNQGLPSNKLYYYNGVDPIRIRLLNTVPRLNGHENDNVTTTSYPWLNTYTDIPYTTAVYADAVKAEPVSGEYFATPIVGSLNPAVLGSPVRTVGARNNQTIAQFNNQNVTVTKGEVTSYDHQTGAPIWSFAPLDNSEYTTNVDRPSSAITSTLPWDVPGTLVAPYRGTDYLLAPITNTLATAQAVTYTPNLVDGNYEVLVWVPGTRGTETLGTQVVYTVEESGQPPVDVVVNQSTASGFISLGNRRWTHTEADPLVVRVTNYSADPADLGTFAYADAVRFVGAANLAVTSTPYQVRANVRITNGGPPTNTPVVVVAAEDGRLYCMDATGNADGSTNVYWTYPSTPDPDNSSWTDPNHVIGEDGVDGIAEMPTGFDLSSALVVDIGGTSYMYITGRNGRIYCIDMAGRGDMDLARRVPGTTTRVWSFPDDYPAPARSSSLGSFSGSLTYGVTPAGPTIFAAAPQGRVYALNALPTGTKTTSTRWVFPSLNNPTLGNIAMTPLYKNNALYFGTRRKADQDRGRFFSVNATTGLGNWEFNGTGTWVADDFIAGPAYAEAAQLGGGAADSIFVANENRHIVSLRASDGFVYWDTDELGSGVLSNLQFTFMNVFTGGGLGARANSPIVIVPTTDGRFAGLFANPGIGFGATNRFGTKAAWGYSAAGNPLYAGMSSGRGFLYGADSNGFLYAFSDIGNGAGGDIDGPGQQEIAPNDDSNPDIEAFRNAKIKFVTKDTYNRLRLPDGDANHLSFADATDIGREVARNAFDWGEIIYVLVYDFPYQDVYAPSAGPLAGSAAPPPVVNYQFSVEGSFQRNLSVEARRFRGNTNPASREGYAILGYILQGGGSNALPPGGGAVRFSLTSSALTDPPRAVAISDFFSPPTPFRAFQVANPLALRVAPGANYQIGVNADPSDPQNLVNGSVNIASTTADESLLTVPMGVVSHGQTNQFGIEVYDRSMMILLRGEQPTRRALENVRFDRKDLTWQNGKASVVNPIDSIAFYATFFGTPQQLEQYPLEFPNTSPDYPDIAAENISVVLDPNGLAQNPVFSGAGLIHPTVIDENAVPFPTRTLNPTPMDIRLLIPRFQPPNLFAGRVDSNGTAVNSGYYGQFAIFVDSNGDGLLTSNRGRREAFRTFWVASSVAIDENMSIDQPTIDFGSLAMGSGYDPTAPGIGSFNPYAGAYADLFKPLTIRNEGNVNLLNIRLAKAYADGSGLHPWGIYANGLDDQAWLNGVTNTHATFDSQFSLTPSPLLQKPRVGDLSGTTFRDNPRVRDNPAIGVVSGQLLPGIDPDQPKIAISVPIGLPSALYEWTIRVISDTDGNEATNVDANGVSLDTSASLDIKFTARESRTTNTYTQKTAPMIDDLVVTTAENFLHQNLQPAGFRSRGGHLIMAFTSDRISAPTGTGFDKTLPIAPLTEKQYRLYFTSMQGVLPTTLPPSNISSQHPLNDLARFNPQTGRWFRRNDADYPTTASATLFPGDPVVPGTEQFGGAAFPKDGDVNPLTGAVHGTVFTAFVGNAQKQSATERYLDSRIFVSELTINPDGSTAVTDPVSIPSDTRDPKSRPTILQIGNNATVFYTSGGTGQSTIRYASYNGTTWSRDNVLNTGSGFESVGSPSVTARIYNGVATPGTPATGAPIIEFNFVGKLAGRPAAEVFFGRLNANANGVPQSLAYLPVISNEIPTAEGEPGVYRVKGVSWSPATPPTLLYAINSVTAPASIEVAGTRRVDGQNGIISFDTTLGGRAFLNPATGTIRLSNTLPNRTGSLFLTYQPRYYRVTESNAQYRSAQLMFDTRLNPNSVYWRRNDNTNAAASDAVRPFRTVFAYGRGASQGQTTRPFSSTARYGVQLPTPIHTQPNGTVTDVTVVGATSFYQIDPANGRIYFSDADENRTVRIRYVGLDEGTGAALPVQGAQLTVGLVTERGEAPILIDQAVNESDAWFSLDPFDLSSGNVRRPGLWWMFYTSSRAGAPDVYFQTLAPKFTPTPFR